VTTAQAISSRWPRQHLPDRMGWHVLLFVTGAMACDPLAAETLTFGQVLRRVAERDASLEVARLRIERAREEVARAESQLAWSLSGQGGKSRDLSVFGIPTDRVDASLGLEKRLSFGPRIGVSGSYARDDAEASISPQLPNPSTSTRADVYWRQPLVRGVSNAEYREGRNIAEAGIESARADRVAAFDALARRTADLYYTTAFTDARLANAQAAITRAERLKQYVEGNLRLGIAEEKDRLQADALLAARRAERDAVQLVWTQQRTTLNRVLERTWDAELVTHMPPPAPPPPVQDLMQDATRHSPDLARYDAQRRQADAVIERNRDSSRDQLDAVLSVGNRQYSGDSASGSVDTNESAASLRLEYRGTLGRSVAEVELSQAMLQRSIVNRELASTRTDLEYRVHGLHAEILSALQSYEQARSRVDAEHAKVDEATRRYRTGRSNTAELIQFENDARAAELLADQQAAELARRMAELEVLSGGWWKDIGQSLPEAGRP